MGACQGVSMSEPLKATRQELGKLCVYGWVRENCIDINMPDAIQNLFVLFYVILADRWNTEILSGMKIDEERNSVTIKGLGWLKAFGTDIIKRGMLNTWQFKLGASADIDTRPGAYHDDTMAVLIGIMESDKIFVDDGSSFVMKDSAGSRVGGYAFYTYLADVKHDEWFGKAYGEKCKPGAVVTMTLDMTQKEHKNGTLSYIINNTDYAIAFDDIDIDKEYCLAVEMYKLFEQTLQILE